MYQQSRKQETKLNKAAHNNQNQVMTVLVDDVTMIDGGKQKITIRGTEVKFDFVDEKTLSFKIRKPTENELKSLKIHCLCPVIPRRLIVLFEGVALLWAQPVYFERLQLILGGFSDFE